MFTSGHVTRFYASLLRGSVQCIRHFVQGVESMKLSVMAHHGSHSCETCVAVRCLEWVATLRGNKQIAHEWVKNVTLMLVSGCN